MKNNFKRHLCNSLLKITNALREIDDADYEWRIFLEKTLVEAYIDNKQKNEASNLAKQLLVLVQKTLPNYYDELFEYMVF